MKIKKRKIGFYYLTLSDNEAHRKASVEVKKIINFICSQDKIKRRMSLNESKFCFLEDSQFYEVEMQQTLVFKSASHGYRAPLIDKETVEERDNPKTINEGESIKTHFLIKIKGDDVLLLGEKVFGGIAPLQLIDYLNYYKNIYNKTNNLKPSFSFSYEIIIKDNIKEELNKLNRVLSAQVHVDKQLLGGTALNFSERIESVKENIVIEIKASRKQSIKETAKDLLALLNGGSRQINKLRIQGKSTLGNDITIDTDFFEKREYLEAQINEETGVVNSNHILFQLKEIGSTL